MENSEDSIIIYEEPGTGIVVETRFKESLWLNQNQMSQLFGVDRIVISRHIRSIFSSGEIEEKSNVQKMHVPLETLGLL